MHSYVRSRSKLASCGVKTVLAWKKLDPSMSGSIGSFSEQYSDAFTLIDATLTSRLDWSCQITITLKDYRVDTEQGTSMKDRPKEKHDILKEAKACETWTQQREQDRAKQPFFRRSRGLVEATRGY